MRVRDTSAEARRRPSMIAALRHPLAAELLELKAEAVASCHLSADEIVGLADVPSAVSITTAGNGPDRHRV